MAGDGVARDAVLDQVRAAWGELAGVPVRFAAGVTVVVSSGSLLCPAGWAGIVTVGADTLGTAPDAASADRLRAALTRTAAATDPVALGAAGLPLTEALGPATLAYLAADDFRPIGAQGIGDRPVGDQGIGAGKRRAGWHHSLDQRAAHSVRGLLRGVPPADAEECGLDEITSPAFVVLDGDEVVAAAGYRHWPAGVAHLSVLTAVGARGRGLARAAASAATAAALAEGLLPQWRARPAASRAVARALGYREVGAQLSVRLGP